MSDKDLKIKTILLSGKLMTAESAVVVSENFTSLKNLRYHGPYKQGIKGMTKINSSAPVTGLIKSGHHFRKSQPSESHVLAQAWPTTGDKVIIQNTTAIPSAGNFSSTVLYTEDANAEIGLWSDAPNGAIAYANQKGTFLWGGDEFRVGAVVNYAPDDSFWYEFTEPLRNTQSTDSANVATLARVAESVDANTMLLLHLDNNVTDSSPTTAHTVTNVGTNVTFSTTYKVFGTHGAVFNGTDAYFTIPDNADFDFSAGLFTIDAWINVVAFPAGAEIGAIFYQQTDADNWIKFGVAAGGALSFEVYAAAATTVTLTTATGVLSLDTWHHVEMVENGDDWYIFVDGVQQAYSSDTDRAANYTGTVRIGYDGTTYLSARMDEYRISNSARHTGMFQVPLAAYGSASYRTYIYIGSTLPAQGFKFYIATANTTAGSTSVDYWGGAAWTSVSSLVDGTADTGKPLAQTGSISFDSTALSAKVKVINGNPLYWYRVSFTDIDATTAIYYLTVNTPFQKIKDIWDGIPRTALSFLFWNGTKYIDYTLNVAEDSYDSLDTASFVALDSMATSRYLLCGFDVPQTALAFDFIPGKGNATASTVMNVDYWNGTAWTTVGAKEDGTSANGVSFAQSGVVSWSAPSTGTEFATDPNNSVPLYYYKISFTKNLDSEVELFYLSGIPAQKELGNYAAPIYAANQLYFINQTDGYKNKVIRSAPYTATVWNGDQYFEDYIGDEDALIAGAPMYAQLGSSLYEIVVLCKRSETWMLVQDNEGNTAKYQVSSTVGCAAPGTMKSLNIGTMASGQGTNKSVLIWQGADAIYMFDGRSPISISEDIRDVFDRNISTSLKTSLIDKSQAFFDINRMEYHWLCATGASATTLNREFVYDLKVGAWYEIERGSGNRLQCGIEVQDTYGNNYVYGAIETAYLERLEYGTTFDSTSIAHTAQTGAFALDDSYGIESIIRGIRLGTLATNTTTSTIAGSYYKDTNATADYTFTMAPQATGKSIAQPVQQLGSEGPATLHSFKLVMTTNNETIGFEPYYLALFFKPVRYKNFGGG